MTMRVARVNMPQLTIDWNTRIFSKPPPSTIGNNCPSRISFFCSQFGRPSECRPFVRLSPSHYHSNRGEQSPVESTCSTPLNPITFRKIVHSKVVSHSMYTRAMAIGIVPGYRFIRFIKFECAALPSRRPSYLSSLPKVL